MSIYAVKLQEWYPNPKSPIARKNPNHLRDLKDETHLYTVARIIVDITPCIVCNKRCKWNRAYGDHSIPWGYGDIWCSKECAEIKRPNVRKKGVE